MDNIKVRLLLLKKRQIDLLEELRKRGYPNLYDSQLSAYISGTNKGPQAQAVMKLADEICSEWEQK